MTRSARWRRWGKWAGTSAAALVAATFALSAWYCAGLAYGGATSQWVAGLAVGTVIVEQGPNRGSFFVVRGWEFLPPTELRGSAGYSAVADRPWWARWEWTASFEPSSTRFRARVPLWAPLIGLVAVSAWLWHRDRRPPGTCSRCGYNLSGVPGGVCPECGAAAPHTK